MKRKLILICVLVSVSILFFACYEEPKEEKTPTPTGFRVFSNEGLKVQLRWDQNAETKYRIQYRSSDMDSWSLESHNGSSPFYGDRHTVQFMERDIGKLFTFRLQAEKVGSYLNQYTSSDWVETTAVINGEEL